MAYLLRPIYFDYELEKQVLKNKIDNHLKLQTNITGEISYYFFPKPRVVVEGLELDFANSGTPSWKDVWIAYNGKADTGKWWLKVGQHHVPFGHATISSSKYMTMMRRPLFADGPQLSRNVGIAGRFQSKAKNRSLKKF